MKMEKGTWFQRVSGETLATFGGAKIVRQLSGKFEIIGGTPTDHAAARQWCTRFMPEVIFNNTAPRRNSAIVFTTKSLLGILFLP